MLKKSLPHLIKRQIKRELKEQQNVIVAQNVPSINKTDTTQSQGVEDTSKAILPYLMTTLGNRIVTGYRVVRTGTSTGLQVYIMVGAAFFDIIKYVESSAGSYYTIVPYSDDQWIYIYLTPDGTFTQNKYSPVTGTNTGYIPLAMIWVEAGSTTINPRFIYDLRPNRVANLSEIYGVRSQQAELYNVIPNCLVGVDPIVLADASESGDVKVHIAPNISELFYIQGHIVVVPEDTLTLTLPESGSEDYYIVAHGYIDNLEMMYKIEYRQVAVGTTIEKYQIIIGEIIGLASDTLSLTTGMIDVTLQCYSEDIKAHAHVIEDLSLQIPGDVFTTTYDFQSTTVEVYVNGIKEKDKTILTDKSFQLNPALESGDDLEVKYLRKY
jgi:hypothetical protein